MTEEEKKRLDSLIDAVSLGDSSALDGIYIIAAKRMLAVAYAVTGDRALAEDVVSDSFVKIVKYSSRYLVSDNPMGWILKIVKNTALDSIRARKRRAEISIDNFYSLADQADNEEKRLETLELEMAMDKLPPDEKKAIKLRYFLDMTVRDTAKAMGLSRSAAERLITKAEGNLKKLLESGKNGED